MLVNLVYDFYSANYFTWDDHRTVLFGGLWKVSDHILTFRQQHPQFDHDKVSDHTKLDPAEAELISSFGLTGLAHQIYYP